MHLIRVPSLAENVEQTTVARWLVAEGDRIEPGQDVVEMLTEKAEFTLEAEVGGTVSARLMPEKSVLPVGTILCVLDGTEADIASARTENETLIEKLLTTDTVQAELGGSAPRPASRTRATPAARRLAREAGVELAAVAEALGLSEAVKEEHVQAYLERR